MHVPYLFCHTYFIVTSNLGGTTVKLKATEASKIIIPNVMQLKITNKDMQQINTEHTQQAI